MASSSGGDLTPEPPNSPGLTDPAQGSPKSETEPLPKIDSKQLLPTIIDQLAETHPDVEWASVPVDPTSYASGYRGITYSQLANAVNNAAWWLRALFGHQNPVRESRLQTRVSGNYPIGKSEYRPEHSLLKVGFLGGWDPRMIIVILALNKLNLSAIILPVTCPEEEMFTGLKSLGCNTVLVTSRREMRRSLHMKFLSMQKSMPNLRVFVLPSLKEWLSAVSAPYPDYNPAYLQRANDPIAWLDADTPYGFRVWTAHTNRWASGWLEWITQEFAKGRKTFHRTRNFIMCQDPNAIILILNILLPIITQSTAVFPLPSAVINEQTVLNVLSATSIDILGAPGRLLAQIGHKKDLLAHVKLNGVSTIAIAGQALASIAGYTLAEHFRLFTLCGTNPYLVNLDTFEHFNSEEWGTLVTTNCDNLMFREQHHYQDIMGTPIFNTVVKDPLYPLEPFKAIHWQGGNAYTNEVFWQRYSTFHGCYPGTWNYECDTSELIPTRASRHGKSPLGIEQHMASHPLLNDAFYVGKAKGKCMLLMQLRRPREVEPIGFDDEENQIAQLSPMKSIHEEGALVKASNSNFEGGRCTLSNKEAQDILERNDSMEILDILLEEVGFCNEIYKHDDVRKEYMALLAPDFKIPRRLDGRVDRKEMAEMLAKAQQDCTMRAGARLRITDWFQMVSEYM